jgi:hypothetical protein
MGASIVPKVSRLVHVTDVSGVSAATPTSTSYDNGSGFNRATLVTPLQTSDVIKSQGARACAERSHRAVSFLMRNFKMPGYTVPDFRRRAVIVAVGVSSTRGSSSMTW